MTIKRAFLDLDRTLLDTPRLMDSLLMACQKLYDLPQKTLRAEIPQFYFSVGELRHYDLFTQLQAHGIGYHQARRQLAAELAGIDFMWPGAREMLQFLVQQSIELHVLSFGKTDYQMFKYHLLPDIRHIPITIVFEDKSEYLKNQSTEPTILVDDKPTWPLPAWCTQLLLDPAAPKDVLQVNPQLWRINHLSGVASVITKL